MATNNQEKKPLILLVEDDKDQAFVLRHFLQNTGYDVDWCNSPKLAFKTAHKNDYHLILLDVVLNAEEDGFYLCRQFKSDPLLKNVPIIMVTARTSPKDRVNGLRLGADDYVTKPFSREELAARIDAVLKRKEYFEYSKRYKELFENTDDIVVFLDPTGKVEHANRHAEFLLAEFADDNGEVRFQDLFEDLYSRSLSTILSRVLEGNEVTGSSWKLKRSRLNILSVDAKLMPIRRGNEVIGIGCILRDSSPREKVFEALEQNTRALRQEVQQKSAVLSEMQKKLIMSEKMAVMGQLAAGIAHELRNPLNIIGTSTYYLQRVLGTENKKVAEHLNIIMQEIQRSQKIITNLLDFSRKSAEDRTEVNINKVLEQTLAIIQKELSIADIRLIKEFNEIKRSYVNPDDMKQIFLNLILNAKEAMPDGGTLTVRTRMGENGQIVVEFKDTGIGIPEHLRDKIFDPFFTAKKNSQGIGIGLAIVHSAIERNNGSISVQSEEDVGTTFVIELPPFENADARGFITNE